MRIARQPGSIIAVSAGMCEPIKRMGLAAVPVCLLLLACFPLDGYAGSDTNLLPVVLWEATSRVTTGLGYRKNVQRTSIAPEDSGFFNTSADASLTRFAESGAYVMLFVLFDDTQYFNAPSVDYERFISATLQAARPVGPNDELGAQFNYLYQHQVVDLSETETLLKRTLVDGRTYSLRPHWKHSLGDGWAVQVEAEALRQFYRGDDISDYWQPAAGARLIRSYGHRSEVSLVGLSKYIGYDSREKFDHDGMAIHNTELIYRQCEGGVQWRHNFDKERQWRTTSKLSYMSNQDNGSGYFDYDRFLVSQQLRWKNPLWEIKSTARLGLYDYPEQEVGDERRERSSVSVDLRIERRLGKRWLVYSFAEHEWNRSNDELDEYSTWAAGGGAGFEF